MARDYAATIRSLIARAEHPNTPEAEATQSRNMADRLMREWRVSEEDMIAVDPALVVPGELNIMVRLPGYELSQYYVMVVREIARHTEVRVAVFTSYDAEGRYMAVGAVGYDSDLRYFELLWTGAHLMFSTRIDPIWDASLPVEENIFRMRNAGHKRKDIAFRAGWDGDKAADRSKVQRMYLREAGKRGEDAMAAGLDFNAATYRDSYADAFAVTIRRRLREVRDASDSVGGVVTLAGRSERVDEAFYAKYPAARPKAPADVTPWVDPRTDCTKCVKAKSGACNDHAYMRARSWTKADEAKAIARERSSSRAAGSAAGRTAAEGVVVTRGTARTNRLDRPNHSLEG